MSSQSEGLSRSEIDGRVSQFGGLSSSELSRYYDGWAATYDEDFVDKAYHGHEAVAQVIKEFVTDKDSLVLDVCAGTGALGVLMAKQGLQHLEAMDGSLRMLSRASEKGVYGAFVGAWLEGAKESLLSAGRYDAVVCAGGFVAGHLKPPVLREFARLTKKGGWVIFGANSQYDEAEAGLAAEAEAMEAEELWALRHRRHVPDWLGQRHGTVYVAQKL